jgi:penicillin amidase
VFFVVFALLVPAANAGSRVAVAGLQQRVQVVRDEDGIPHIIARNEHDAFFMQGWVHAEDRFFQMDSSRRQASGTLAEVLGAGALPSDIQFRTFGLRRAAERSLPLLSHEVQEALDAYADGVNSWLETNPLPPEYRALEIATAEPWTPVDSIVIAKLIAFGLSFDLDTGLTVAYQTYVGTGQALGFDGDALFTQDLYRSAPFDPASTVPDAEAAPAVVRPQPPIRGQRLDDASAEAAHPVTSAAAARLANRYLDRIEGIPMLEAAADPRNREAGSNEWAVAGALTADGRPIMANDPHLALNTPATFHQSHLRALNTGLDVIGSGFPGVPGIVLGQNRRIAWGATTNPMDVTDTYLEQVVPDPTSPSGLATIYDGNPEPIIPIPVTFEVNQIGDGEPDTVVPVPPGGGVPPAVLIVPRRNNGPIIELDTGAGIAFSVQYTGFSGTRELDTFYRWNKARNLREFREGLSYFDFGSQNWAYVDTKGTIAYFTSGEMPLREDLEAGTVNGAPPWFIRNGTGGNEWLPVTDPQPNQATPYQLLPMEEMPQLVNPESGWFVNANNDPAGTTLDNNPLNQLRPTGGIFYLNPGYAGGFRAGRITREVEALAARGDITPVDMAEVQANVSLLDAEVLVPHILEAAAAGAAPGADPILAALAADPGVAEAVARLASWDGTFPTGVDEGYDAADVDGSRAPVSVPERDASVAATIYSVWRGQALATIVDAPVAAVGLRGPGDSQAMAALRNLLDTFETAQGIGASGIDFFQVPGVSEPEDERDVLLLQSLRDALDLLASDDFAPAFSNSTDQDDYAWGRLHRIVLDHPLGGPFNNPPGGIAASFTDLPGLAVDGGFGAVDASSHSARADEWDDFMFGSGPVRRYVGHPVSRTQIRGYSSMPGGSSGVIGHPWYANLLPEWLTNETHLHRQRAADYRRDASSVTNYVKRVGRR